MALWAYRGHQSGVDLAATVARSPALAGRRGAEAALREALDAWAEQRRVQVLEEVDGLLAQWREEARALRRAKLRQAPSERLDTLPGRLVEAVAFIPDASAIVARAMPAGLLARLAWRQPAAGVSDQALADLRRTLARRLDPALAREAARDAVLLPALGRAAAAVALAGG